MPESRYADDLKIALDLADHADEITMARFQASDLVVSQSLISRPYQTRIVASKT